jgi:hypothetical protein
MILTFRPLAFVLTGYCGNTYQGTPSVLEGFGDYWDEALYLEILDYKIGYDWVNVQYIPLCHDDRSY